MDERVRVGVVLFIAGEPKVWHKSQSRRLAAE